MNTVEDDFKGPQEGDDVLMKLQSFLEANVFLA